MILTRTILFIAFVVTNCQGADHDVFKSCSEIDLCNTFRDKEPNDSDLYTADVQNADLQSNTAVIINLSNQNSNDLTLNITLANNNFRIIIEEVDSSRYHLQDVLDGVPEISEISLSGQSATSVTLNGNGTKAVITSSPFKIEFYQNDVLEVVFDGSRLIFDTDSNAFTFKVDFSVAQAIYGVHEHADQLALQNTSTGGVDPYRLRNLDVAGFETYSPMSLYGAVPVLYGHGTTATAGIFLHNAAEQWIDINSGSDSGSSAYFITESGVLDLFVLLGPTPQKVVQQYTKLTGYAHLPQFWTLGYHQCRWNYQNDSDVKDVIANLDNNDFPVDVIWLDIDYTDSYKYFTWNLNTFVDPVGMQQNLSATNRKLVTIIDPHIKVEEGYEVYDGALENDYFVKYPNGTVFQGDCWPGLSSYIDFLNPDAREYYGSFYNYSKFPNTTETLAGIWNDMNEPSVFDDSIEKTLPGDIVHYGNVQHRDIHNIYGLLHTKATHAGLLARDPNKRPFILTRSHFAGSQRYAIIWTGDNTAAWDYMIVSIAECLNANILGIVFCGSDVGGFDGNPDEELLQRWYQLGAWIPFYREHATNTTERREPYLFDDDVQNVIRYALRQRYQHIYVFYTLFFEYILNEGVPIIRPLFYHYPEDPEVITIDKEFLVGRDILVAPVLEPVSTNPSTRIYLPGDDFWYDIYTRNLHEGNQYITVEHNSIEAIPVFYRAGSIIPKKLTPRRNTEEMKNDPFTVVININSSGYAEGTLYQDDYESFAYQTESDYSYWKLEYYDGSLHIDTNPLGRRKDSLKIDSIIVNTPKNNEKETYEQIIYKTTIDGVPFKTFQIGAREKIVIDLI